MIRVLKQKPVDKCAMSFVLYRDVRDIWSAWNYLSVYATEMARKWDHWLPITKSEISNLYRVMEICYILLLSSPKTKYEILCKFEC